MAAPTGGGGKFTIIKKKFDPTKTTLREVVEMYINESKKARCLILCLKCGHCVNIFSIT